MRKRLRDIEQLWHLLPSSRFFVSLIQLLSTLDTKLSYSKFFVLYNIYIYTTSLNYYIYRYIIGFVLFNLIRIAFPPYLILILISIIKNDLNTINEQKCVSHNNPSRQICRKPVWRSVFFTIWTCILNTTSTKTHSSSVTFLVILPAGII